MKKLISLLLVSVILTSCGVQIKTKPSPQEDLPESVAPRSDQEGIVPISSIWCMGLLGKTALEIAEAQNSSYLDWALPANTSSEYDVYIDPTDSITLYYLFAGDEKPLYDEKICHGVLLPLKSCFSLQSDTPQDMIQELSDRLECSFRWFADNENERRYYHYYLSGFHREGKNYQIFVFTDSAKHFSEDSFVQLILSDTEQS